MSCISSAQVLRANKNEARVVSELLCILVGVSLSMGTSLLNLGFD